MRTGIESNTCSILAPPLAEAARACVDEIDELEMVKASICARQARLAAQLDELTPHAGDRGTGAQLGLARRESPHRGRHLLTLARALVDDLPCTMAALDRGEINERRAEIIVREGQDLPAELLPTYDEALASAAATLGDTEVQMLAQRTVMRLDEAGAARRFEAARARRRVTSRRVGDGHTQITALVADFHAGAVMGSLHARAATELATAARNGDDGSRSETVADIFVQRLTGAPGTSATPVNVDLVVSAETLFGGDDEPGETLGFGPVPASVARRLVTESPETATVVRRFFADTDHLVAMESDARTFNGLLRQFIGVRDRTCRTPWCGAPVRHVDHVTPVADGGPTTALNGQGLCESCNQTKEEVGWRHRVTSSPVERHEVEITTPTGHVHRSRAPDTVGIHGTDTHPGWELRAPGV